MLEQLTADELANLVRLCFTEEDPAAHGVPKNFRAGVLNGFVAALDEAVAGLCDDTSPRVQRIVDAMHVMREMFPEVQ